MKESYEKGLANRSAPNPTLAMVTSRVWHGQGVHAGQPSSSEINIFACRPGSVTGKATRSATQKASRRPTRRSLRPCACVETPDARTGRSHEFPMCHGILERSENASGGTADMHAHGKSDVPIVPAKRTNKTGTPAAESVEERGAPEGNAVRHLLAPDTAPGSARHGRARLRLVKVLHLDRYTQGRSRMR